MCGIAGIAGPHAITPLARQQLRAMMDLLVHRGPDDSGTFMTPNVALGQRRLSIIDLHSGRQPIANEDGTIHIVVNGEIYDFAEIRQSLIRRGHSFKTSSDSEVIVHLYEEHGEEFLDHVNGMFAIAVWDERQRRLLLARDRLGLKPLYYCVDGNRLLFASELKSILVARAAETRLDQTALFDFLVFGFIPSPKTIFDGIHKLEPGQRLIYENGQIQCKRWWDLRFDGYQDRSIDEWTAETWHALKAATRRRMVADVKLGAFLSGGVDSMSVVASMVGFNESPPITLTCGFDREDHDERAAARETAALLGTNYQERLARVDMLMLVDRLAWHFDEPFADASAIPLFQLCEAAKREMTVALSGDGGDEVLAGYRRYRFDAFEHRARSVIPSIFCPAIGSIGKRWPRNPGLPRWLRAGTTLTNIALDPATAHGRSIATMMPEVARRLLNEDALKSLNGYDPLAKVRLLYSACDAPDHVRKCQYVDIRLGLGDGILTKVDRASMAHALEVRAPLLDYTFVEHCWSMPPRMMFECGHGKAPLRRAIEARIKESMAWRRKAGFDVPMDAWFRSAPSWIIDQMKEESEIFGPVIQPTAVNRLYDEHKSGKHNHGAILWRLLMLNRWAKRFMNFSQSQPQYFAA